MLINAFLPSTAELVVAMSGKVDYVSDGRIVFAIENGSHWQEKITGSGCMASSCVFPSLFPFLSFRNLTED